MNRDLCFLEGLLGPWDVMYPLANGIVDTTYTERLILRDDYTYVWNPAPSWAANIGKWTVVDAGDGLTKLCFETKGGSNFREHYLVIVQFVPNENFIFNWTRTRGDIVIFTDRVFEAKRPRE